MVFPRNLAIHFPLHTWKTGDAQQLRPPASRLLFTYETMVLLRLANTTSKMEGQGAYHIAPISTISPESCWVRFRGSAVGMVRGYSMGAFITGQRQFIPL